MVFDSQSVSPVLRQRNLLMDNSLEEQIAEHDLDNPHDEHPVQPFHSFNRRLAQHGSFIRLLEVQVRLWLKL
jgi:hypothetical protein